MKMFKLIQSKYKYTLKGNNFKIINKRNNILNFSSNLKPQVPNSNKSNENKTSIKSTKIILSIIKENSSQPSKEYKITQEFTGSRNRIKIERYLSHTTKKVHLKDKIFYKLKEVFLPKGFPYTVGDGYYDFVKFSFLYNIIYYYINFISTQIAIESLGYSVRESTALSAGLNWALKEGIGQIASIYGISKYGKTAEKNVKEWRAISLLIVQFAFLIELSILLFPNYFVILAASSCFIKITFNSIAAVCRTGVYLSIAKKDNLVDLTLKHQNQSNVSILIGNALGFLTTYIFSLDFSSTLAIMVVGTIGAFYFTIRANKYLVINHFNLQRIYHLCKFYIRENKIASPTSVSKCETLLFNKNTIHFCTLNPNFLTFQDKNLFLGSLNVFEKENFICFPKMKFNFKLMKYEYHVYTFLRINYKNIDILKAMMCTVKLEESLNTNWNDELKQIKLALEYVNENIKDDIIEKLAVLDWKTDFHKVVPDNLYNYHLVEVHE